MKKEISLTAFYPPANRYAGKIVNIAGREISKASLRKMSEEYLVVFEAYLAGVRFALEESGYVVDDEEGVA